MLCGVVPAVAQPLPSSAFVPRQRVNCPVCRHTFEAYATREQDNRGGIDRDLFARAQGPQTVFYLVSTCPSCLYSGYLSDFGADLSVSEGVIRKIRGKPGLKRPSDVDRNTDQQMIDPLDRYELAIQCYNWSQRSDEAIAWLHLRASWVARDSECTIAPSPQIDKVARHIRRWLSAMSDEVNPADAELRLATLATSAMAEGHYSRYQESYIRFFTALLYRRHGENRQAQPLLSLCVKDPVLEDTLRKASQRMLDSIRREQYHQAKAFTHFEQALLADQIASPNRPLARYLCGELCRRLDRGREALKWYDLSDERGTPLPEPVRTWKREQKN